jgi:hypothetical protein
MSKNVINVVLGFFVSIVLVLSGCGGGGGSDNNSNTPTPMNLAGTWIYTGNFVAPDDVESHVGKATVTQNSNVASFNMNGTWSSSKTGDSGPDNMNFSANVTSTGLTMIQKETSCYDSTNTSCLCTVSGVGSGNSNTFTLDITTKSKTCGVPFTITGTFNYTPSTAVPVFTSPQNNGVISKLALITWSSPNQSMLYVYNDDCSSSYMGCMDSGNCVGQWNPTYNSNPSGFAAGVWHAKIVSFTSKNFSSWSWNNVCPSPPITDSMLINSSGWSQPLTFTVQ